MQKHQQSKNTNKETRQQSKNTSTETGQHSKNTSTETRQQKKPAWNNTSPQKHRHRKMPAKKNTSLKKYHHRKTTGPQSIVGNTAAKTNKHTTKKPPYHKNTWTKKTQRRKTTSKQKNTSRQNPFTRLKATPNRIMSTDPRMQSTCRPQHLQTHRRNNSKRNNFRKTQSIELFSRKTCHPHYSPFTISHH